MLALILLSVGVLALMHTAPFPFLFEAFRPSQSIWRMETRAAEPSIYLTFDDGPNPVWTPPLLDALAAGSISSEAVTDGYDLIFARVDLAPAIADALEKVPQPFRSTLTLVDIEDQSYEAAAEILGVPIGTVRSRLFRGRRIMQEQLLDFARDVGLGLGGPTAIQGATSLTTS